MDASERLRECRPHVEVMSATDSKSANVTPIERIYHETQINRFNRFRHHCRFCYVIGPSGA